MLILGFQLFGKPWNNWVNQSGAASVYIKSIRWITSRPKSWLWLYFNVFCRYDLWQDISDAILLLFFCEKRHFLGCKCVSIQNSSQLEYFCTQLLHSSTLEHTQLTKLLSCGGIFKNDPFIAKLLECASERILKNYVSIWWSYNKDLVAYIFGPLCSYEQLDLAWFLLLCFYHSVLWFWCKFSVKPVAADRSIVLCVCFLWWSHALIVLR